MKTIVLVCLGNFQEYIMTNIVQLIRLGHTREQIHVIISRNIEPEFEPLLDFITLAYADDLEDEFDFNNKSQLNKEFRDGFWHYTSARFFVLYAYLKSAGLTNVVHIENDVLIYYNVSTVFNDVEDSCIYMPFDSYERNVASIMYIPNANILGQVLASYDYSKNDMYNFSKHCSKDPLSSVLNALSQENRRFFLNTLPICIPIPGMSEEQLWISKSFSKSAQSGTEGALTTFIFDAAALGQMVGGVDPRNIGGDTRGFVNEECVIKYNDYGTIVWINFKPYYRLHMKGIALERDIPIFNLHIHSKNLHLYSSSF
jgi:hypothetical protein